MSVGSSFGNLKLKVVEFDTEGTSIYLDTFIPLTATIFFTSLPIVTSGGGIVDISPTFLLSSMITYNPDNYSLFINNLTGGEQMIGFIKIWYTE